ncbi:MAG: hypothetical protein DKM24_05585 [Candidatus Melainabacteria bacterium]|nr:MAG: hypothetical protein DKM24_05585 [Candidatus Melainabacteria bacterium]
MVLALVILGIFLILSIAIFRVKAVTVKVVLIALLTFMAVTSVAIMVTNPQMHKMFSMSVIDYLIKFNDDGSITTTKQTTTTEIKQHGGEK